VQNSVTANSIRIPGSIWIIGLSSAGKSTLSRLIASRLWENNYPCMLIDGDEVRGIFADRLGYDPESRRKQTQRILRLTRWVSNQGILPIVAIIHPFEDDRKECRKILYNYFEVYLQCELSECIRRDPKNIYAPALEGKAKNVVGIDIPYDPPENPDLVLDSTHTSPEELLEVLWAHVQQKLLPSYQLRVVSVLR
jgi:adenylyl-sulfate kinase